MKTLLRIVLLVAVGLMLYLNIGWHLGGYYNAHILYTAEYDSFMAEALAGWGGFLNNRSQPPIENPHSGDPLQNDQRVFSVLWPFFLLIVIGSWIVCGGIIFFGWVGALIGFFVWLIFQGGFGEILANQDTIPWSFVVAMVSGFLTLLAQGEEKVQNFFGSITVLGIIVLVLSMIFS